MTSKARIIPLAILAGAAIAGSVYYFQTRAQPSDTVLRVSGNIEVVETQVSFKIAGRVERRLVDEGELVTAGQTVAVLDPRDLDEAIRLRQAKLDEAKAALAELRAGSRPEEIAQARAAVASAKARLDELKAGSRPEEIAVARAATSQAEAELDRRKIEYDRLVKLRTESRATDIEFEQARTAYDAGVAMLDQARERYKLVLIGPRVENIQAAQADFDLANAKLDLTVNGPRKETIDQADARVRQSEATLDMAKTQRSYATLVSPGAGVVLSKHVEPGEMVQPGAAVVTVGELKNVWVQAYVNETDLGRIKIGQKARVTTDTWPGKEYAGRVSFISSQAEFTPKIVQTEKERVKLVYRIKIDLENPNMELKPGMPADAEIQEK